jgi:hypothetical protein
MNSKIKFGIVGTGFIADVVANAIKDAEAKFVAVASRPARVPMRSLTNKEVTTPSHQPRVVHMIQNFIALTANPVGQAARGSMHICEQTQSLLDAVRDQLTKK